MSLGINPDKNPNRVEQEVKKIVHIDKARAMIPRAVLQPFTKWQKLAVFLIWFSFALGFGVEVYSRILWERLWDRRRKPWVQVFVIPAT